MTAHPSKAEFAALLAASDELYGTGGMSNPTQIRAIRANWNAAYEACCSDGQLLADAYAAVLDDLEATQRQAEIVRRVLRTLEERGGSEGSCDWGHCSRDATGWRFDDDGREALPVCTEHQPEHERLRTIVQAFMDHPKQHRDIAGECNALNCTVFRAGADALKGGTR